MVVASSDTRFAVCVPVLLWLLLLALTAAGTLYDEQQVELCVAYARERCVRVRALLLVPLLLA